MKIYLLKRAEDDWGYDEASGFVVIAKDAKEARQLCEGQWGDFVPTTKTVKIRELKAGNKAQIVLRDFHAG